MTVRIVGSSGAYNVKPGDLVLIQNSKIESEASRKPKPRYMGQMVVVWRMKGGSHVLVELDGAIVMDHACAVHLVEGLSKITIA